MAPDARLEGPHDPTEIVAHPTRPGFTLKCRNCGVTNDGMWADSPAGFLNAIWFDGSAACQAGFVRRQKILRFRELKAKIPATPVPSDLGGLPTVRADLLNPGLTGAAAAALVANPTLVDVIPDSWVM